MAKKTKNIKSFVISDCYDENAKARYVAAFGRELGGQVHCVGAKNVYEAAGCTIDIVDELRGEQAVVFVNAAPRKSEVTNEGHKNGRPFYYFKVGKTIVVSSAEKILFEMFQKIGINISKVFEIDLFTEKGVPQKTQFRSAQCIPVVAGKIASGKHKAKRRMHSSH